MDKFAKRLQSRLSARGFRFNKEQCRQALQSTAANPELPTDEEMVQAFNWLLQPESEEAAGEIQTVTVEPETSDIELTSEETEAIASSEEQGQTEPQTNLNLSLAQSPEDKNNSTGIVPRQSTDSGEITQAHGGITQAQVTQAIAQAVAQVGQQGNSEAVQILTTLANELSSDIADTQEMVVALVNAYLGKRQFLLSSAIGTLNTLRTAQTESFQAGLDQNFFGAKDQNKRDFLAKVGAIFN